MEQGWDARSFQAGCSCFRFNTGSFSRDAQYRFFQYAKTLDMTHLLSVPKLYIWLMQNGVEFTFRYRYNLRLPIRYNLMQLAAVTRLRKMMQRWTMEDIMAYDLGNCRHALHP